MPCKGLQAEGLQILAVLGDAASMRHSLPYSDAPEKKHSLASKQHRKDSWNLRVCVECVAMIRAFLIKSLTNDNYKHTKDAYGILGENVAKVYTLHVWVTILAYKAAETRKQRPSFKSNPHCHNAAGQAIRSASVFQVQQSGEIAFEAFSSCQESR